MNRDLAIAWRNLRQYRSRLTSLLVVTALGCIACLTSLGLVSQAASATQQRISEGTALRTVELHSLPQRTDVKALTKQNVDRLRSIPHVSAVEPSLQASFGIKTEEIPGVLLYGTVVQNSHRPPLVKSARPEVFPLKPGELVLPARSQGSSLEPLLGRTVQVTYTRQVAEGMGEPAFDEVTVVGLYDPAYADDGPNSAYAPEALVVKWAAAKAGAADFLETVGYTRANLVVDASANVSGVLAAVRADGFDAVSLESRLSELPGSLKLLQGFGYAVFAVLLLFCSSSGLALAGSFVRSRTREIGLLKAVGFARARIFRIFLLEMAVAGLIATVAGVLAGNVVGAVTMAALGGTEVLDVSLPATSGLPDPLWSLALLAAPVAVLVLGALRPARRAAAMAPDSALRDW